ncbi:MAG TPA: hypothetical protein VEQ85_02475 [Lacipirellulaceae bacterium]|nr:hypothetical protein [Lacipirellulaceae bacterium]
MPVLVVRIAKGLDRFPGKREPRQIGQDADPRADEQEHEQLRGGPIVVEQSDDRGGAHGHQFEGMA